MAGTFDVGETVICTITVTTSAGVAADPADSMKILITWANGGIVVVPLTAMTDDADVGNFHYDFQTVDLAKGRYEIQYIADDGTRITIQKDTFTLS